MKIYKKNKVLSNHIQGRDAFEGQSIESEMRQVLATGNIPERNLTQIFYTRKQDGVLASTDIRTDTMQLGQDLMSKANNDFHNKINEQKQQRIKEQQEEKKIE